MTRSVQRRHQFDLVGTSIPRRSYLYPGARAPMGSLSGGLTPAQLTQQIGQLTGTAATGALSAAALSGLMTTATAGLVIPIVGAGILAVTTIVAAILNSGCGQSCIVTSNWANQAEQALIQNIQAYFALPAPRSQTAQAVALANFDNTWNYLVKECGQPGLSTAGMDCISDRQRGACKWNQTSSSPLLQYPNEPQPGQCWNWFTGYRDPIAMDPAVPDSLAQDASQAGTGVGTGTTGPALSSLFLYGGLALLALGVLG